MQRTVKVPDSSNGCLLPLRHLPDWACQTNISTCFVSSTCHWVSPSRPAIISLPLIVSSSAWSAAGSFSFISNCFLSVLTRTFTLQTRKYWTHKCFFLLWKALLQHTKEQDKVLNLLLFSWYIFLLTFCKGGKCACSKDILIIKTDQLLSIL